MKRWEPGTIEQLCLHNMRYNIFTGKLDIVGIPLDTGTSTPGLPSNGDLAAAFVDSNGRLYFRVNGTRYYVNGTAVGDEFMLIETGDFLLKEDGGKIILDN